MKVHDSALKHGIDQVDAMNAAQHPQYVVDLSEDPQRQIRLGFDTRGRLLEVVVLTFDSGDQLVIHAMRARRQYAKWLD